MISVDYKKPKAQAVLELAIFAALILSVFGSILYYVQKLNDEQMAIMESFRRALHKANHNNAVVTYTVFEDKRRADVNAPLKGSEFRNSAYASVYWAVPYVGERPNSLRYYKINNQEYKYTSDKPLDDIDIDSWESVTDTEIKSENPASISTKVSTDLDRRVRYTFKDKDGNIIKLEKTVRDKDGNIKKVEEGPIRQVFKAKSVNDPGLGTFYYGKYETDERDIGFEQEVPESQRPYRRTREWQTSF